MTYSVKVLFLSKTNDAQAGYKVNQSSRIVEVCVDRVTEVVTNIYH